MKIKPKYRIRAIESYFYRGVYTWFVRYPRFRGVFDNVSYGYCWKSFTDWHSAVIFVERNYALNRRYFNV